MPKMSMKYKTLTFIGIMIFLFSAYAYAETSYDVTQYFSVVNTDWHDFVSSGVVHTTFVNGTRSIAGVTTGCYQYYDGTQEYYTSDTFGIRAFGTGGYSSGIWNEYIFGTPLVIAPQFVQVGQTYYGSSYFYSNGYYFTVSSTAKFIGLEDVTTASGAVLKNTLKSEWTISVDCADLDYHTTSTDQYWFYKNMGCVKQYSNTYEALSTIKSGVAHYISGRAKSYLLTSAENGFIYVEYVDENYNGRGYGRLSKMQRPDGGYILINSYSGNTEIITGEEEYDPDGCLVAKKNYDSGGLLIQKIEYYSSGNVKSRYDPIVFCDERTETYIDEAYYMYYGHGMGRLSRADYPNGDWNTIQYFGNTNSFQYFQSYHSSGDFIYSHEFYDEEWSESDKGIMDSTAISGRNYSFVKTESGVVTSSRKFYSYIAGTSELLIEYSLLLSSTYGGGMLYYFYDGNLENKVAARMEFDNGIVGEITIVENGAKLTKAIMNGNIYWFLWGDNVYQGYNNVVIEKSSTGQWIAHRFTPNTENIEQLLVGWITIGTVADPSSLVLPELGDWWQYCADNNIIPEFPPLSSDYVKDGLDRVTQKLDHNPYIDTTNIYTWDSGVTGHMKWDIYYDYDEDGNNELIDSRIYNNGADYDLSHVDSWTLLSQTYGLNGITYTYYNDTGRMYTKTLPDGTIFEYSNEAVHNIGTPNEYGHLTKETRPDLTYKTFSDYYNSDQWRFIMEYAASGELIVTYEFYISGRLKIVDNSPELGWPESKHIKKYFTDEDLGFGYGFVYRIDNITDGYYTDINNIAYGPGSSEVRKDLATDAIIEWIAWTELYPDGSGKRVFFMGSVHEYDTTGRETLWYGRDASEYETWTFGVNQALKTIYDGKYVVSFQDPLWADVQQCERRIEYLYDTQSGNLIFIGKTFYDTDGVTVLEAYTYYAHSGYLPGRMHTRTTLSGTIYEYDNTDVNNNGTPSDDSDDYGHLIKETNPDGTYKTFTEYFDADHARFVKEYAIDTTLLKTFEYDFAGILVGLTDSTATYTYFSSGCLWKKTLLVAGPVDPVGTIYEYNEVNLIHADGTSGYGHLIRQTMPDGTYKTFTEYFDADHARFVEECSTSGVFLKTYEYNASGVLVGICAYYASGRTHTMTLYSPDTSGNVYYHYMDEDASRVDKSRLAAPDADGCLSYAYYYSGDTNSVLHKVGYSDANWATAVVSYTYYTANMTTTNMGDEFTFNFRRPFAESQELLTNHRADYFYMAGDTIYMRDAAYWQHYGRGDYGYPGPSITKTIDIASGGGILSFDWTRFGQYNYLHIVIDGRDSYLSVPGQNTTSGSANIALSAGSHTITWYTYGSEIHDYTGHATIGKLIVTNVADSGIMASEGSPESVSPDPSVASFIEFNSSLTESNNAGGITTTPELARQGQTEFLGNKGRAT